MIAQVWANEQDQIALRKLKSRLADEQRHMDEGDEKQRLECVLDRARGLPIHDYSSTDDYYKLQREHHHHWEAAASVHPAAINIASLSHARIHARISPQSGFVLVAPLNHVILAIYRSRTSHGAPHAGWDALLRAARWTHEAAIALET